jgi:polysaccharide pyruvyl transferase CsaB
VSRVLIAGYFGYGNLGDEAILTGMLAGLKSQDPSLHFSVVGGDAGRLREQHGVDGIRWEDIEAIVAGIRRADLVVLGGGGLFHDYWPAQAERILTTGHEGIVRYAGIPLLASLLNKPCMIYAVGVGPLGTEDGRRSTRSAFELADAWTVRDAGSMAWLEKAGITLPSPLAGEAVSADPAFLLLPAGASGGVASHASQGIGLERPYFILALRHWDLGAAPESWELELAAALDEVMQLESLHAVFLPAQDRSGDPYTNDGAVARRIRAAMRQSERAAILEPVSDPRDAASLIAGSRAVVAMRMHAALLAGIEGVPAVAMAYDPKVEALMVQLGEEGLCLAQRQWRAGEIATALRLALAEGVPPELPNRVSRLQQSALRDARRAIQVLRRGKPALRPAEAVLRQQSLEAFLRVSSYQAQSDLISSLKDQRLTLMVERNRLLIESKNLNESLGGRLIQGYWNIAMKVLPEGTRRREAYRIIIGQLKGQRHAPQPERLAVSIPSPHKGEGGSVLHGSSSGKDIQLEGSSGDAMVDFLRFQDAINERGINKVALLVTTTPLTRSEGQRATQLAFELADRKVAVVYSWWRWDPGETAAQNRLDDGIFQLPIDILELHTAEVFEGFKGFERLLLMEFPLPSLFGGLARANAEGWLIIYDLIDDWSEFSRVGQAPWFDRAFETHLIAMADAVMAVSPALQQFAASEGDREVALIPNATLAGIETSGPVIHLERGERTLGYFGHLSPAWVDWRLVRSLALKRPSWRIYVIGYGEDVSGWKMPPNLVMLGKQPQESLAAYASNWDVAIVPFKVGRLAQAADPIKIYEYFAMGLPVVMSGTPPPPGTGSLLATASGVDDFIQAVEHAALTRASLRSARKDFACNNDWVSRVDAFFDLINRGDQRIGEKKALLGIG